MSQNVFTSSDVTKASISPLSKDRFGVGLAFLAVVLAGWTCAVTFVILRICYSPVPIGDMWDFWAWSRALGSSVIWHLTAQHNEHRIAVGRLFFLFDQYFCSGTAKSLAIFIPLIQLANGLALCFLSSKIPGVKRPVRWFLGATAVATMFSSQQFANLTWYFQIEFIAVFLGATLCCMTLVTVAKREKATSKDEVATGAGWRLALTVVLAVLTSYCVANGLLIWPVLLLLAYLLALSRRVQAVLLSAAIVIWIAYFRGYVRPADHPSPLSALLHLPQFLRFLVTVIGSPFADAVGEVARKPADVSNGAAVIGCAGLIAALCFLGSRVVHFKQIRGKAGCRIELVYIHLLLFAFCSVGLIASGRFTWPVQEAVTSRYTTPALLFWLFLISLLIVAAERSPKPQVHWMSRFLQGAVLTGFLLFLLTDKPGKLAYARGYELYLLEPDIAMANDVFDQPVWRRVNYYNMDTVLSVTKYFKANHLSMYDKAWRNWLNDDIRKHYGVEGRCPGSLDLVKTINYSERPGYRVEGWAWNGQSHASREHLILTDKTGHILGSGIDGFPRPDVATSLNNPRALKSGWVGYVSGLDHTGVTAYLILPRGKDVCLVGSRETAGK